MRELRSSLTRAGVPGRELGLAAIFVLALVVLENSMFELRWTLFEYVWNYAHLAKGLGEPLRLAAMLLGVLGALLLMVILCWLPMVSVWWARWLAFGALSLVVLFEYGFARTLHRFSIVEDLINVGATDLGTWMGAIRSFSEPRALVPIGVYGTLLLLTRKESRFGGRALLVALTAFFLFFSVIYSFGGRNTPFPAIAAFFRTGTFYVWDSALEYRGPRQPVDYRAAGRPTNNVILVVDESIRGDHLSINGYARETTPFLRDLERRGLLTNWGVACAASTFSVNSNQAILTGLRQLPDLERELRRLPSIFQYARAMGYRTYYLDASHGDQWNGGDDDRNHVDQWLTDRDYAAPHEHLMDFELARHLRELLGASVGNFLWVNKRGPHWPYHEIYPPEAARWQPVYTFRGLRKASFGLSGGFDPREREQLVNSYDNALLFNVNGFFEALFEGGVVPDHTVLLYTGDHGQTLSENGETWSHGLNTRNEAKVPLFIISPKALDVDTGYRASHSNIFATLLDLIDFPESERLYDYDVSLLEASALDSRPRRFHSGALDGRGLYEVIEFDAP